MPARWIAKPCRRVGILLPAYNEERNLPKVLREVKKFFPGSTVLVVDDGSRDATSVVAKRFGAHVIRHKTNKGKGEAVRTGFSYFRKRKEVEFVLIADADGQYSLKDGWKLLGPLVKGEADFVMGCRNFEKVPFRHRLGNFVWRKTFNLLFGTDLKDTNCGYVALNRKVLERISVKGGYIIENHFLVECLKKGWKIKQVPVSVEYSRKSKILRGIRVVTGVLTFIIVEGVKFRLGRDRSSARESDR